MEVVVLGINHETAPVSLREKVAFRAETIPESLGGLIRRNGVQEGMIVSTCNRVELYAAAATREAGISALEDFLCGTHGLDVRELRAHLYSHSGTPALKHIFRVCSSLDSLILGEPQILKQVKEAYQVALSTRAAGGVLNRVLHAAFRVAKRVRTETGIAAHAVSVSYAAVELAKKIFGELHGQTVLLIGAGEMGELAAKHLQKHGAAEILVANRTWEKAVALAGDFNGTAVQFEKLASWLPRADIVISAAAVGSDYLVTRPMVHDAIRARKHRPVFLIDIAVPRTIAPDVNGMGDVYLYGIDDLRGVVEENKAERRREAERAELIVDQEAAAFADTLAKIDLGPTIARLTRTFEAIRRGELERAHAVQRMGNDERELVEKITRAIVNKIAHEPILALKDGVLDPDTLAKVFGLAELEELPEPLEISEAPDAAGTEPAASPAAATGSGEKKSG